MSQSLIAYHAGAFTLKTSWGEFHKDQGCLAVMCGGRDELSHIQRCGFYTTKWKDSFKEDCKSMSKYFVDLDKERRLKWRGEGLF